MIYENVKGYCNKERITIHEFEKICRIGNGTVGKWKGGIIVPSIRTLSKIEESTGVPIREWLCGGTER